MDAERQTTRVIDDAPRAASVSTGPNRHERRAGEVKARQNRKLFARYKVHMALHGYDDATFDDFIRSIP